MAQGSWAPCDCAAQQTIAIIVPYRDRLSHLYVFLNNIIRFLQFQRQAFTIFVVEQTPGVAFNRAALFNAALREIEKRDATYDCFIVHDVDSIPENLCAFYHCADDQPVHMSALRSKNNYVLPYDEYVGGVLAMSRSVVERVHGMSNLFFGWGQEDDNLYGRFELRNLTVSRLASCLGRFRSLEHEDSRRTSEKTTQMVAHITFLMLFSSHAIVTPFAFFPSVTLSRSPDER